MSYYEGVYFFIILFMTLCPAIILGVMGRSLKFYSIVLSFFFIWIVYMQESKQLWFLILFVGLSCYVIKIYLYLRKRFGRKEIIYYHFIALVISPLVICKISEIYGKNIFAFLGISYITFKLLQMIIEIYDNVITDIKVLDIISFLTFFPTISSGPIDRSRRFLSDLNKKYSRSEYLELFGSGLLKILCGLLYKIVFSTICYNWMIHVSNMSIKILTVVGYAYLYGFYMFFDFAGYSLMAVGTSYILGIKTPDNFKMPFISIDIKDFWNRWHITLSHWFRDFIFSRVMIKFIRNKCFKERLGSACGAYIINMFIMGIWHGLDSYYILYGVYHGVLLAITEVYQKKSNFYKKNKFKCWYKVLSWFITINLVMFGFLIFSGKFNMYFNLVMKSIF